MKINIELNTFKQVEKIEDKKKSYSLDVGGHIQLVTAFFQGEMITILKTPKTQFLLKQSDLYGALKALHVGSPVFYQKELQSEFDEQQEATQ